MPTPVPEASTPASSLPGRPTPGTFTIHSPAHIYTDSNSHERLHTHNMADTLLCSQSPDVTQLTSVHTHSQILLKELSFPQDPCEAIVCPYSVSAATQPAISHVCFHGFDQGLFSPICDSVSSNLFTHQLTLVYYWILILLLILGSLPVKELY